MPDRRGSSLGILSPLADGDNFYAWRGSVPYRTTAEAIKDYVQDAGGIGLPLTFPFADDGVNFFYAEEDMTLTQVASRGSGTITYAKSTAAAPATFSNTTSPIDLEAGAWLRVTADLSGPSPSNPLVVQLKRTA